VHVLAHLSNLYGKYGSLDMVSNQQKKKKKKKIFEINKFFIFIL